MLGGTRSSDRRFAIQKAHEVSTNRPRRAVHSIDRDLRRTPVAQRSTYFPGVLQCMELAEVLYLVQIARAQLEHGAPLKDETNVALD